MCNQYNRYLVQSSGSGIMEAVVDSQSLVDSEDSSDYDVDNKEPSESSDEEDNKEEGKPHSEKYSGRTPMSLKTPGSESSIDSLVEQVHQLEFELEEKDKMVTHLQVLARNNFDEFTQITNENIELKSEIESLKSELDEEQTRLEVYRNNTVRHLKKNEQRENKIEALKAEINTLKEATLNTTLIEEQAETLTKLTTENSELKRKLNEKVSEVKSKDQQLKKLKEEANKLPKSTSADKKDKKIKELENQIRNLQATIRQHFGFQAK